MSILTNSTGEDNSTKTGLGLESKTGVEDAKTGDNTKVDVEDAKVEDGESTKVEDKEKSDTHLENPKNWRTALPKAIRDNEILKNYEDYNSFLKESIKALSSDKGIVLPKVEEDDKWNELFDKLGRPKTFEDYEEAKDIKLTDTEDGKGLQEVKSLAYKLGLNQKQFGIFYEHLVNEQKSQQEAYNNSLVEYQKKAESDLKKEWGKDYDVNLNLMTRGLTKVATNDEIQELENLGLGNNLTLIKIFKKVGETLQEDSVISNSSTSVKSQEDRLNEMYPSMKEK